MTKHANLLRDGAHDTAIHVRQTIRRNAGQKVRHLCVRPSGRVRVMKEQELTDKDEADHVGTYTREAPLEVIVGDLQQWLTENPPAPPRRRSYTRR